MKFINLCRTNRSLGQGLLTPDVFIEQAVLAGQPTAGIIDFNTMSAAVAAAAVHKATGTLPVIGTTFGMVWNEKAGRDNPAGASRPFTVIARNTDEGIAQLVRLNTLASTDWFHYQPRLELRGLTELAEAGGLNHLLCLTGGPNSTLRFLQAEDIGTGSDVAWLTMLRSWFADVFVELHIYDTAEEMSTQAAFAAEHRVPALLNTDTRVVDPSHVPDLKALRSLIGFDDAPVSVTPAGRVAHAFVTDPAKVLPAPLRDQVAVSGAGQFIGDLDDSQKTIIDIAAAQATRLVPSAAPSAVGSFEAGIRGLAAEEDRESVDAELKVIAARGLAPYLLTVAEVCDFMRDQNIPYAVRGSASGSKVCHLLGITQVDPTVWGLRSDRFLSPSRVDLPDIDLDIDATRRHEVVDFVAKRWTATQVGTYQTGTCDQYTGKGSLVPKYFRRQKGNGRVITGWAGVPDGHRLILTGIARHSPPIAAQRSAAGWLLTTDTVNQLVPLMRVTGGEHVTQFTPKDMERLGLFKLDLLSSIALTVLSKFDDPPTLDDPDVYRMLAEGHTGGVFQLEGETATKRIPHLAPTEFNDLVCAMALYRPAMLVAGKTTEFEDRRNGRSPTPVRHPIIADVTTGTYGMVLFQEQVLDLMSRLNVDMEAAYSLLEGSKIAGSEFERKKIARAYRSQVEMACEKALFGSEDMEWVWEAVEAFTHYGFNRAHATAYALLSYKAAWLVKHRPAEFFAALLTAAPEVQPERQAKWRTAARSHGLTVRRPHVNLSSPDVVAEDDRTLRAGLASIPGVSRDAAESIWRARLGVSRPFTSIVDLATLVEIELGERANQVLPGLSSAKQGRITGMFDELNEAQALKGLL